MKLAGRHGFAWRRAEMLDANASRLASLRSGLRSRMAASPLCDGPGFAGRMEAVYRTLWRDHCLTMRKGATLL